MNRRLLIFSGAFEYVCEESHLCHFLLHLNVVGRWLGHIVEGFSHIGALALKTCGVYEVVTDGACAS